MEITVKAGDLMREPSSLAILAVVEDTQLPQAEFELARVRQRKFRAVDLDRVVDQFGVDAALNGGHQEVKSDRAVAQPQVCRAR